MSKRKQKREGRSQPPEMGEDLRLNPQDRLCSRFDENSIAKFPVAKPGKMGMRVLDNCAEENIQ